MPTSVLFTQVLDPNGAGTPLYETHEAGACGWAGFVVTNNAKLPPTISISASLSGNYSGGYLFYTVRPPILQTAPAGFAASAISYIKQNAPQNRALVWLKSATAPYFGTFAAFGFQFGQNINLRWQINTNMNATLGQGLTLNVNNSLLIAADETAAQLVFSVGSSSVPLINLQIGSVFIAVASPMSAQIPLSGPNTGCLLFKTSIQPAVIFAAPPKGLAQGLQYVFADSSGPMVFPVLDPASLPASLGAIAVSDPSDPVNTVIARPDLQAGCLRTGIVLAGTPALPTTYRTQQGNPIALTPIGTDAAATVPQPAAGALALTSAAEAGSGVAAVYLAPAGGFGVSDTATQPGQRVGIMGGLFGSEGLLLNSYSAGVVGDRLVFVPSQPAFAPVFPFEVANLQSTGSGALRPRLTEDYRTSWATVLAATGDETLYQAEPEGSALYGLAANPQPVEQSPPILISTPPRLTLAGSTQHTFPLIPYARAPVAAFGRDTLTQFESQIVAPTRKTIISAGATAARARRAAGQALVSPAAAPQYAASPQGFLVTSDGVSGAYRDVLLAQSLNPAGGFIPFRFTQPGSQGLPQALQDALQTNQLFLVAVDPANLGVFDNVANVAGWTLSAKVGQGVTPTSYRNVMILKFCSGTLLERVGNPNRWTSPEQFSLAPGTAPGSASIGYAGLSQYLQAYIQAGIAKAAQAGSAEFYRNFAAIAQDPDWTGVIVLQADLVSNDLPPQIAGLAAGIDFSRFTAHHFGFTVSRITADPSQDPPLQMQGVSSFFGLIDYQEPAYELALLQGVAPDSPIAIATTADFQFTVLLLQVLFENAAMADFKSKVQLTVNRLFGSSVTLAVGSVTPGRSDGVPAPALGIVLDGSYVAQTGSGSAASSYVFQQTATTVFRLDSKALQAVAFDHIQFNTLGDDGAVTTSRFLVWGALDFVQLADKNGLLFDVLSFGSAPNTPNLQLGSGLAFANLSIELASPNATPNVQNFTVATANIAYDLNASTARSESLFRGFGLQLKSFISAGPNELPANFGFLPVGSDLDLVTMKPPWQGVVYRVTLGGPGALASSAGFESDLLLAWSPSAKAADTRQAVFIGLSLPGASPGAKLLSLQGVFKVSVGAITLLRQQIEGHAEYGYCLRLNDIGVKILGIAKLPPSATIQFFLFGDPGSTGSLGWYAAYVANDQSTSAEAAGRLLEPAGATE